jgi:hypothetical protein
MHAFDGGGNLQNAEYDFSVLWLSFCGVRTLTLTRSPLSESTEVAFSPFCILQINTPAFPPSLFEILGNYKSGNYTV